MKKTVLTKSVITSPTVKSHRDFMFRRVLPFFINIALGVGVKVLLDRYTSGQDIGFAVLLVGVALAVIVLTETVRTYIDDVRLQQTYRVSVHQNLAGIQRKTAFDYCAAIAHQAKESIVIIGPHFPAGVDVYPTHDEYVKEGLEKALTRGEDSNQVTFRYRRIVQLEADEYKKIHDGVVEDAVIGNDAISQHIKDCLVKNAKCRSLDVKVYAKVFIPSFPSIMIVDHRYVFFSLPTETWSEDDGVATGKRKHLDFDFVLAIEDQTGQLPRALDQIVSQFEIESKEIKNVKFPRGADQAGSNDGSQAGAG